MIKILKGYLGNETFYLAKEVGGWTGFTQLLTATIIPVESIEEGLSHCKSDEISGLQLHLEEITKVCTIRQLNS